MRPFFKLSALGGCLLLALASRGAGSPDLPTANNEFGFKLIRELTRTDPEKNICISPFSLASVLQIVRTGAAGETRNELDNALGVSSLSPTNLGSLHLALARSLKTQSTNCILETANAIWFAPGLRLHSSFESLNGQFYEAHVAPLDFTDPRTGGMVNSWLRERTHGRITEVLQGSLPGSASALIVNATYFQGKWATRFDPAKTRESMFNLPLGQQKRTRMMELTGSLFLCSETKGLQIARLPYADGGLAMFVLLPGTNSSPVEVLRRLTAAQWIQMTAFNLKEKFAHIVMPRFQIDCSTELKPTLLALGVRHAFQRDADFSGISSDPLFVERIVQKASVKVDEVGTTATAAAAALFTKGERRGNFEMILDRPFFFAICDRETQSILFLGVVQDPT